MTNVRFARLALAIAVLFTLLFMWTLPFPPASQHERTTLTIFGTLFVLEAVSIALLATEHWSSRLLVYVLGVYGLAVVMSHGWMMARGQFGDTPLLSLTFALVQGCALAIAAGAVLFGARRRRIGRPA
jgi:multisubunit Na+/H+ antiporter MnhG subunit